MVSTPSVTVPSDDEISAEFRVHVVLGFTAPPNRHLKHVCTPPSTVSIVLREILKVSMHTICELPVDESENSDRNYKYMDKFTSRPRLNVSN